MPSAIIGESLSAPSTKVDRDTGVVSGCRLAEVGRMATFAGLDGMPQQIRITPKLIDGLLALCSQEERLSGHWTHKWATANEDALLSRVATWRNFRIEEGNLIADAFTYPGDKREAILHAAENDPRGMMVSMIFGYGGTPDDPIALDVRSADFVAKGACTTALCSAVLSALENPTKPMPEPTDEKPFTEAQEARLSELVTAAVSKSLEGQKTTDAILAEFDAKLAAEKVAILTQAKAEIASKIGQGGAIHNFGGGQGQGGDNPLQVAVLKHLANGAKSHGVAIARALADDPSLEEYRANLSIPSK